MPATPDDESSASTPAQKPSSEPSPAVAKPPVAEAAAASGRESRWLLGGVLGLLALFGVLAVKRSPTADNAAGGPARVERIRSVTGSGLYACAPSGSPCQKLSEHASIPRGSRVKTDFGSEGELLLADGSTLKLDRGSELGLSTSGERGATLLRGGLILDVARRKAPLKLELPHGSLSTAFGKLAARTAKDFTNVEVVRGTVRVEDRASHADTARAGELVRLTETGLHISPTPLLGSALALEQGFDASAKDGVSSGLGQLSARKPGAREELTGVVRLVSHAVRVRIAGALSRTEIEEVFANSSDQTLEGIYRFPIPPDAQLERLALDVDGKWVEGAFVDRDRAAAIWRGAIVNAAPQAPRPLEEIVWVPGPWRDPALLEWQRGGRFELRIFPIPRHGERKVILSYTELVQPSGGTRRYTYPLAHAGSTGAPIDRFDIDVSVRGHDPKFGVQSSGYELSDHSSNDAIALSYSARNVVPSGDLGIEYTLPNPDAEARAWAYQPGAEAPSSSGAGSKPNDASADNSAYVAIALRPHLPAATDHARRALAITVDSSRSMLGESYERAKRLAARMVRELDADDRVRVLACDSVCRANPETIEPGAEGEAATRRFLDSIAPDGASDPTRAVRLAYEALPELSEREARIVYIGDGAPTVGPIRPAHIEAEVARALPAERARLTAVAIGPEADSQSLSALARGGGGVVVRYAPGESLEKAAFAVLGASYGRALRDVEVTLPEGLYAIAPTRLDAIPAGGEQLVVARMTGTRLAGDVVLRGRVGQVPFERRYPLQLSASSEPASAFVPRLYAALRITELERDGSADAKRSALALSTRFAVASRYTSLLVLESEAMFQAFGLDRSRNAPSWTGEEAAESATAEADDKAERDEEAREGPALDQPLERKKAARDLDAYESAPAPAAEARASSGSGLGAAQAPRKPAAAAPMAKRAAPSATSSPEPFPANANPRGDALVLEEPPPPPLPVGRPRRMIPMRRVWQRSAEIDVTRLVPKAVSFEAIADAERKSLLEPDRREPLKKLYTLLALGSELNRAEAVVERWSTRDALDVEALTARADLAAQRGERDEAIRLLGSVIDARPADIAAQRRLERLERWAGQPALACRHLVAAAELRPGEAQIVSDAVRCSRAGGDALAERELLASINDVTRRAVDARLASAPVDDSVLSGDLRVEATWLGGEDLDLALLDSDGQRMSWLGAPTRAVISARDVTARDREGLAIRGAKPGEYLVEVVRSKSGGAPLSGELVLSAAGTTRRIAFKLSGTRERVAVIRLRLVPHLEPLGSDGLGRPF